MPAPTPASTRDQTAPSTVNGTAASTRIGSVNDSNVIASTAKSSNSTGTRMTSNQLVLSSATDSTVYPAGRYTVRTASWIPDSSRTRSGPDAGAALPRV